ncbi:LytR/AlgR family response regulator transcription factor [Winogradskyella aurantiaca]|uniref:LytR/AlgR family response regulator transcription factor n=1 Tax=Winogradskyella aurantiaca TaxID=2219558 RepID=UPI000E1D1028|nr:LytTR family DNA-binding domain-containing protein [Winogradskyella aurantiaca]
MTRSINCIIVDDESVARGVIATHLTSMTGVTIVAQCSNAIDAFNVISKNAIDLVFLDINMPDISGIAFAKSINKNIRIIFTTAYRDYAVEGFDLQAVDYVVKPVSFERLLQAVNRYFEITKQDPPAAKIDLPTTDFIFVRANRQMQKLDFAEIRYVESYSDYIKIQCEHQSVVTRETISNIEAKLPRSQFLRIHRSYIVAIKHISSFTHEHVVVGDKTFTISRSYKTQVLKLLEGF